MSEVKPEWQGTAQHGQASDLSRWLVHLTRSEEDLFSILKTGRIEARMHYGAGRSYSNVRDGHRSVCLTEIPLHELGRMTAKRPWGIVFDKERLRAKFNAQPVWYISDPSPQLEALDAAMYEAVGNEASPIWKLTPFMERVRSRQSESPNDWRWEREWRVLGNIQFVLADVAMIVVDDEGASAFFEDASVGVPWVSSDDSTVRWCGGFTEGWEGEIDSMLERFREQFIPVDEADLPWDSEHKAYFPIVDILDTSDAMEESFGQLAPELHQALEQGLSHASMSWCRTYDLAQAHE